MKNFDSVKDSGDRTQYETGAVRDARVGKGRYDLIPPMAMRRIAKHFENGALKYQDRNWEIGIPLKNYLDSAERHLNYFKAGLDDEDHLAAAAWNIMCLIETELRVELGILPKSLDDLPRTYKGMDVQV